MTIKQQREHARMQAVREGERYTEIRGACETFLARLNDITITSPPEQWVRDHLVTILRSDAQACERRIIDAADRVRSIDDTLAAAARAERQPAPIP